MCLYIGDNSTAHDLIGRGIASEADLSRGALLVLPERGTYLHDGRFDPDVMLGRWEAWVATARAKGFTGVRLCGWATWALDADIDFSSFIEYEARLTDFLAATSSRVMCHYLFGRFQPSIIHDVLRTHPMAIVGEHLHDNVYFEPPLLVLGGNDTDRQRIEWMRQRLQARPRRDLALANLGRLALAGAEPTELMHSVAQFVASEVEVDLVEVSELLPSGDALRVAAAAGSVPLELGRVRPIGSDAAATREALRLGQPLIVPDWSEATRHRPLQPLTSPPMTSSASVVIGVAGVESIFGVLSMHSTRPHIFTEDEVVMLESVAAALALAIERKRREDEFRALVEHSPDAVVRIGKDLRIRYANPAFERWTGRQADSLIGTPPDGEGASLLQPVPINWELDVRHVLRTGREHTSEYTAETPSGERVLQARIVPEFSTGDREVHSVLIVLRDITQLARALTERERLSRELLERERRHQERLERLVAAAQEENRRLRRASGLQQLTQGEQEVLRLIAQGRTNNAIGGELHLSPGTVKNRITRLLRKLGAADRAQAAALAGEMGLTESSAE
jgi:PAS domain S-box-containing protein